MIQPTREEVEAFITALNYGMKVSHKPEFLIALAEGWLKQHSNSEEKTIPVREGVLATEKTECSYGCNFTPRLALGGEIRWLCANCGKEKEFI